MKYIPIFGLVAGGIVAVGRISGAQWQQIGQAALALTLRYGLTVLPWLLAALFCWLWWRQRDYTQTWRDGCRDWTNEALRAQSEILRMQQATPQRKRPRR